MTELEEKLLQANKGESNNASAPLRSHGPDHHWRAPILTGLLSKLATELGNNA